MNNIIDALNWRYATKKFDSTKKLSQDDMNTLLESLRLSPASFGLETWRFIHVKNPEIRTQLQANSRWQPQITEASDLIVIATQTNIQESDVNSYLQNIIDIRGGSIDMLESMKWMIIWTIWSRTPDWKDGHKNKHI